MTARREPWSSTIAMKTSPVASLTSGGDQDMGAFLETVLNALDETNR